MTFSSLLPWLLFHVLILGVLALDLGVFHRHSHEVSVKEALIWSAVWIGLSLLYNLGIYFWKGSGPAMQFLTGYLIEKALSVDNIFVFIVIFSYFNVPARCQHKVLFWGILSALGMRASLIALGATLMQAFHGVIYIFGAFLIFTGIKLILEKDQVADPSKNLVVRLLKRWMPITPDYHDDRFFVRDASRWLATPLLLVLLVVEATDIVFAVDSIPAIFAVTSDPFIVYTSNIFAILGLRSLYFALAGVINKFHYLKLGLSFVLIFVGTKMMIVDFYKIPIALALAGVVGILGFSVVASFIWPPRKTASSHPG